MDPRNIELHNLVNLRASVFRALSIFMAAICNQFAAAGLKDISIEEFLISICSIEKVMKGKQ